jgi:hypothetical protein
MGWWNDQSGTSGIYGYVLESFDGYTPIPDTVAIGGTVTGLEGSGLVLQNKGGDDLTIDADGPFTFDTALTPGSRFDVTVAINPANPEQSCRVQNGSGSVTSDPVTDIQVFCGEASSPSDDTAIIIETNVTDGSAGIRIFLGGEGWKKTSVANPDGRKVFNITAKGKLKQIGLAEMVTRSGDEDFSEMTQAELLALFPEGIYQFESKSVEGEKITKEARLSHDLPCAPQNLSPSEETVDTSDIDILWDAVNSTLNDTGDGCRNPSTDPITIENYHVIVEDVSTGNEFNVALPAFPDFNRVAVPGAFIEDDKTYRVEVLAIAENGNQTIAETFFCTGTPGDPCADPGPGP